MIKESKNVNGKFRCRPDINFHQADLIYFYCYLPFHFNREPSIASTESSFACGEGASNEQINEFQAAWNVTNAIQGMFIVSLPYAVMRGGYWAIIAMVGIAYICCYTGKVCHMAYSIYIIVILFQTINIKLVVYRSLFTVCTSRIQILAKWFAFVIVMCQLQRFVLVRESVLERLASPRLLNCL